MAFALATALCWLAVAVLAAVWPGRRPESQTVCVTIAMGSIAFLAVAAALSIAQGIAPQRLYLDAISEFASPLVSSLGDERADSVEAVIALAGGVWVGLCVAQAAGAAFLGICARYAIERRNRRLQWSPFSELDLSVLSVYVLLVGVLIWVAAAIPGLPAAGAIELAGENIIVVGVIPLFVQGAAAGKGLLDNWGLGFTAQVMLGLAFWLIGVFFLAVPLIGLLDFWANFRKLPRDEELGED